MCRGRFGGHSERLNDGPLKLTFLSPGWSRTWVHLAASCLTSMEQVSCSEFVWLLNQGVVSKGTCSHAYGFFFLREREMYVFPCRTRAESGSLDYGLPRKASGKNECAQGHTVELEARCPSHLAVTICWTKWTSYNQVKRNHTHGIRII